MTESISTPGGSTIELRDDVLEPYEARIHKLDTSGCYRLCYAALHVVMRKTYRGVSHSIASPGAAGDIANHIDWETTCAHRERVDRLGFGIAEAMDTAQRFSLGWENAIRLIEMTGQLRLSNGFIAGAGTDHLPEVECPDDLVRGVVHQGEIIQGHGGQVILLPMPWLARRDQDEDSYVDVYAKIIDELDGPIFVHWLGAMFAPDLAGYFPGKSFERIMALNPKKVRGAKLSLLDPKFEIMMRERFLAREQIVMTGDDVNFAGLLMGEDSTVHGTTDIAGRLVPLGRFSHALLGILDAIAKPASLALRLLDHGDLASYKAIMGACEELGEWVFQPPTRYYKAGLAFIAWLNGQQDNPMLINHEELTRDIAYYLGTAERASKAGVLADSTLAKDRIERLGKYLAP